MTSPLRQQVGPRCFCGHVMAGTLLLKLISPAPYPIFLCSHPDMFRRSVPQACCPQSCERWRLTQRPPPLCQPPMQRQCWLAPAAVSLRSSQLRRSGKRCNGISTPCLRLRYCAAFGCNQVA